MHNMPGTISSRSGYGSTLGRYYNSKYRPLGLMVHVPQHYDFGSLSLVASILPDWLEMILLDQALL